MDQSAKSKATVILGIVILVVDLIWVYAGLSHGSPAAYGNFMHRNFTGNSTYPNFTASGGYPGVRYSNYYANLAFGVIILVADLGCIFLNLGKGNAPARRK